MLIGLLGFQAAAAGAAAVGWAAAGLAGSGALVGAGAGADWEHPAVSRLATIATAARETEMRFISPPLE
jgi:hypothetical protein